MNYPVSAVPVLLNELYDCTTDHQNWTVFLGKLATLFRSETATLRVTDLRDPVVFHSYTTGLQPQSNHCYESVAVELDPFRETLATNPLGVVTESTAIISDPQFERSEHFQTVFRPNGNFYAMGTQFERLHGQGMHIGIHRPKRQGPFDREETGLLELFSPHLRKVTQLSQLLSTLNQTLAQTHRAMNHLPFGVWQMDDQLRVQWMNAAAEEALSAGTYGLSLRGNHMIADAGPASLRARVRALAESQCRSETLKLGQTGACLVMTQSHQTGDGFQIGRGGNADVLCFLLDSARPAQLDQNPLCTVYQLTLAEYRLASVLVTGLDITEASALLQISPHTGRTQLKSIMHKTGVNRQANLQRKLLLCADTLRTPPDE